jgi:hypothetical protein
MANGATDRRSGGTTMLTAAELRKRLETTREQLDGLRRYL